MQDNVAYPWTDDLQEHSIEASTCDYNLDSPYWFIHKGYIYNIRRNNFNVWLGYVYIPQGHPCFDKFCEDIDVQIHGGLTYSGLTKLNGIDYYIVGFDCAHYGDIIPEHDYIFEGSTYKDYNFVKQETIQLAEQLWSKANEYIH